jgi:hypothetical protein
MGAKLATSRRFIVCLVEATGVDPAIYQDQRGIQQGRLPRVRVMRLLTQTNQEGELSPAQVLWSEIDQSRVLSFEEIMGTAS